MKTIIFGLLLGTILILAFSVATDVAAAMHNRQLQIARDAHGR